MVKFYGEIVICYDDHPMMMNFPIELDHGTGNSWHGAQDQWRSFVSALHQGLSQGTPWAGRTKILYKKLLISPTNDTAMIWFDMATLSLYMAKNGIDPNISPRNMGSNVLSGLIWQLE